MQIYKKSLVLGGLAAALSMGVVVAAPLEQVLPDLLKEHDRIIGAQAETEKARLALQGAKGAWLPTLDGTFGQGYEQQHLPNSPTTHEPINSTELKVSQLVYDFGEASATIQQEKMAYTKAQVALRQAHQSLILDAVRAHFNVYRATEGLKYAKRSESNIKTQTGMEESRVKRGSGLSTDVLQAKSSLAGAMATRVRAEGALAAAVNNYRQIFGISPDLDNMPVPPIPYGSLPNTVEEAVEIGKLYNASLQKARMDMMVARYKVREAEANMAPRLNLVGKATYKKNDGSVIGLQTDYQAKVEVKYNLFNGGQDISALKSARQALIAQERQLSETTRAVEASIRNAWDNLNISRSNAQFLKNQSNISGEFLDYAQKERKLGTASLLDVLNGEAAYLNSLSSTVSAESDSAIAVFALLDVMGQLPDDVLMIAGA